MGKYSIKELERLSGIKAHTIRIWEKRHQLIEPQRTDTNIRFYSDEDLKKIINVSLLNNNGLKISRIAELDYNQLVEKVLEFTEKKTDADAYINQLMVAMVDMDEGMFDQHLSRLALKFGIERTITEVIYPFLDRIGILWQTGNISPAQEHFISNLVRQKLIVAIDALPLPAKTAKVAILFLPDNELHEIGLLFCHYLVKKEGLRVIYLGQMVPYGDLKKVGNTHPPQYLVTSMVSERPPKEVQAYFNNLSADFPNATIIATGAAVNRIALSFPPNFYMADKILKIKDFIKKP